MRFRDNVDQQFLPAVAGMERGSPPSQPLPRAAARTISALLSAREDLAALKAPNHLRLTPPILSQQT